MPRFPTICWSLIFNPSRAVARRSRHRSNGRIAAAACFLPLTVKPRLSKELGTRHRAAIGVTEETDAVAIIVSEETGAISFAHDGEMERYLDPDTSAIAGCAMRSSERAIAAPHIAGDRPSTVSTGKHAHAESSGSTHNWLLKIALSVPCSDAVGGSVQSKRRRKSDSKCRSNTATFLGQMEITGDMTNTVKSGCAALQM